MHFMTTQTEVATQSAISPTPASAMRTYVGSCHCGDVRFKATLDLRAGVSKCNCSICMKKNFVGGKVKPEDFALVSRKDALSDYQFNSNSVRHQFCKRCGIHAFGHANIPQAGGEYYSVNVHCLGGADLEGVPVRYCDGLNNNWWNEAPAFP